MKLIVLYLLAVCCYSLANTSQQTTEQKKLREILRDLKGVQRSLPPSEMMLNTPQNIGDHCSVSALRCFREELRVHFNMSDSAITVQRKFYRSLGRNITVNAFGEQGSAASNCTDCDDYPKENVAQFFKKMESLIQMAIARLN